MGCFESGGEDELQPGDGNHSKRLKLPRKFEILQFSGGCNTVNHAPVPRKLRSAAIKKRNHESISSPSFGNPKLNQVSPFLGNPKLNQVSNGVGRLKKDAKKSKMNLDTTQDVLDRCINKEVLGSITEDEQEVAETLYALAAMLPDTSVCKTGCNNELPEGKSLPSPEVESSVPSINVLEMGTEIRTTTSPQLTDEASKQSPNAEEIIKSQSSSDNQLDRPVSMELPIDLNTDNCEVNLTPAAFFKPERISENNVVSTAWSNLHLPHRISQRSELERSPAGREKLEIGLNPAAATYGMQPEVENKSKEKETNATSGSLWPGLSLASSCSSNMLSPALELYDVKCPEWFGNNAFTARTQTPKPFAEKNGRVPAVLKNSWKRCCTHVYVCRLIKALQISERADKLLLQSAQSTQTNGSKQGIRVTDDSLIGTINDSHTVFSSGSAACSVVEKTTNEVRNAIFLHKKLLQDQRQDLSNSKQLQNPDFVSFPTQGMVNGSSNATRAGQTIEASKQLHVPHIASENQQLSFLLPQNRYSSASFGPLSSTAAAHQVLLPPHIGNADATVPPRLQLHRQEIQIWPTHLTAAYKHGEVGASHIPEWQNGGQNTHPLLQSAQTMFPGSRSSLDTLPSKHAPISLEQQQRLMPISSSLSGSRVRGQYYRLPDGFEGNARGLYPNSIPALQMLCNGHH
ncbi:PREDICTED: uncharacterized protein LOC109153177 isoform X2 [Ipomoea nil]|uniref:uncharacterized protein LOC109153177 isoform X2 n=1 Tax=Ipomoea nil TaxID=35883 RepID=UPI000901A855|nr:PREDICTED: uncharacterized protein LOC109153177 isoform X2 [Ipomoea nil]